MQNLDATAHIVGPIHLTMALGIFRQFDHPQQTTLRRGGSTMAMGVICISVIRWPEALGISIKKIKYLL